jgi:cell division protein FtsN
MEEAASWKSHGFTLLIFAGLVVLSAIFFVLGMLLGRSQGQQMAVEHALAARADKPASEAADKFPLDFYSVTKESKTDPAASELTPAPAAKPPARPEAKPADKAPKPKEIYLQVAALKTEKQANDELKKVVSKGFKAKLMQENKQLFRILVGPYKESEVDLAIKDLRAKGYKQVLRR